MTDLLAVVALVTSPFWLLMLLNANRGRSRTQALSGVMVELAHHFGLTPNREGGNVAFSGEIDTVPIEFTATNLETSPRLKIRVSLPSSLKVVSFRPKEESKGIGRFESGDKNFDSVVASDGEVPWLGNILDSNIRAGLSSVILSLSGKVENGQLTAEIPITLQENEEEGEPRPGDEPPPAPPPAAPTPELGGVMVSVGPPPKPPTPSGTLGYLVGCTDKVVTLGKALIAESTIRVDRLCNVARDENAQGVRLAALKGLMLLQRPEKVAGFVEDNDPVVRLFACSQVGDFGVAHAEAMMEDLQGPVLPADARFPADRTTEALKAWRPLKEPWRIRTLLHRFCRSVEPNIRHAAIAAAVRLQIPDPLPFLRSLPELPEDRSVLIQAILHLGDPNGELLLWRIIARAEDSIRHKAMEALGQVGSSRSVEMLEALSASKLPEERADGSFVFTEPLPNKEGKMERMPVSPALSRAARDVLVVLQQRLENKKDSKAEPGKGMEEREERSPPPSPPESTEEADRPAEGKEEGRARPVIKPEEALPPSAAEQVKIDARKARIEARRQEIEARRQEAEGQKSEGKDVSARIAEAQARAAAMRPKS